MRYEDICKGMRLVPKQGHYPGVKPVTVVARSMNAMAVQFDGDPEIYAWRSDVASLWEPERKPPGFIWETERIGDRVSYRPVGPEQRDAEADVLGELVNHPAVRYHGKGVTSPELASFTGMLSSLSQTRIVGTGHAQYDLGDRQKFELQSPDELASGLLEEAADAINYIAMGLIKFLAAARATQETA